ncbi:MAG: YkgJ family cysteine cluster protein [Treponema sp.]|nr:YkgJ family cysteine cluster protein [Treponema sp.]
MTEPVFYASGLRFSCKRCSSCCRYESGYVFLSEKDLEKLAAALKTDSENFIKIYCRWIESGQGSSLSLREKSNNDCIFWDTGCTVYEARPLQCRTFPFWESVVASAGTWEVAASGCPGINSGKPMDGQIIEKCLESRKTEPIIIKQGRV